MCFKRNEISFFFKMYPIAKVKCTQLDYQLYKDKNNPILLRYYQFYNFIIRKVEKWLQKLSPDEQEIVEMRYFKNYSLEKIAINLGYANHSAILYKDKIILRKLEGVDCND